MIEVLEARVAQTDAFTLQLERDPLLRSTIVAVAVFDRLPDFEVLRDRIDRATRLTPTFRERLRPAPFNLAPPRWLVDQDFDLSWHLRRARVPEPGTLETVLDFARTVGMAAFDHDRPLWEFTLLDGLADGRAALVMKVHHSLTDGIGGIQLAAHVVDLDREVADLGTMPDAPVAPAHGPLDDLLDALRFSGLRSVRTAVDLVRGAPATAWHVARDPLGAVRDAGATASSIARFVRPVTTTLSPVMTERHLRWHFEVVDVPFAELHRAAKAAGGTLNDAFVGAITGGLRRYHEAHGTSVDALRLTMPISTRTADDEEGGNKVTLVRFEVPVGIEDPVERMQAIDALAGELRHERALPHSDAIAGVLNLLPIAVTGGMLKHVDFLASNVPGFDVGVFVGGAEVVGFYPFGPTLGSAANITLMSYRGTCHIGVNLDAGAVPDPDVFMACLQAGIDEVLAVGA